MQKILCLLLLLSCALAFDFADLYYRQRVSGNIIVVHKKQKYLKLYRDGRSCRYPVATGKNTGDKQMIGDLRTPEGVFRIISIEPSGDWAFDFGDGRGPVAGAYGPWFLRFEEKPWQGIAIHGTHDESTIGLDDTHGCIRMRNADLLELKKLITVNYPVVVLP
ncbi:MAG: L,D-transpeptidase [Candidatus Margulisbacteria bacterium]|jgi:lipoprotein-anchoring transpeptidase ErfK/SrfK|nr:L,D-transpeptidase [Candidatus Margulisiibacteriota bacterium]